MRTPSEHLAALAIRHLDEAPESRRPDLMDAAAEIFAAHGAGEEAETLKATAALSRTADQAQRKLSELFKADA